MAARDNVDTGGGLAASRSKKRVSSSSGTRGVGKAVKSIGKRVARQTSSGTSGRSSSRRSSGGGGGGGLGRGRDSSGNLRSGRSASNSGRGPAPGGAPSINSYLGTDSTYQQAVRGQKRSLTDFLSEIGRRRGEATTQFNQTKGSMERDRTRQLADLQNEFASRGLLQSGLYGEEQGRFQQQFTDQLNALGQQQNSLLADLLGQETNYKREQDLALEAARQEALARRAARYKIGA